MHETPSSTRTLTLALKEKALELGLDACGISKAGPLDLEAERLNAWLGQGHHASMRWMENHLEKRIDPTILVKGARSVVSVLQSYYNPIDPPEDPKVGRISRYAWGDDYHLILKERLSGLMDWLKSEVGEVNGRIFVDSAPVMDKAWASRSGLGWIGKHSNLISPDHGSWTFIGELIIDVELSEDQPILDHCGSCTECIDHCPTNAIVEPYVVDANRCISYTTIEHRGEDVDAALSSDHGNWIFGCDVCQEVCPWNKFRTDTSESRYAPRPGTLTTPLQEWEDLDQAAFSARFSKSAVKRTKLDGFRRNVRFAKENSERENRRL